MSGRPRSRRRRPGWASILLPAYLLLLLVSHGVRCAGPPQVELSPAERAVDVRAVDRARLLERPVRIVYTDTGPPDGQPVLLLHGSPGSKRDFAGMVPELASRRRVIAVDLPGFGRSTADVPDYSARAHARYAVQLIDHLGFERVDLVGFSMGGGVALNFVDIAPRRVRSLVLLSAIGVQELELLGNYHLNHLVHAAQLGAIWLAREGLPHMGWLDGTFVGVPYARNFYDTDQRPLRGILRRIEAPTLILHGEADFLVPPEVAREHHRLIPHSELQMSDAGHFEIFRRGQTVAGHVEQFLTRVDAGIAASRSRASADRREAAALPWDPSHAPPFRGFALALVLALVVLATLVSEDLTCIGVGLIVSQGRIDFLPGVAACFVGIYCGDLLLFFAGRFVGRPALSRAPLRWFVRPERVELASRWFERRGPVVIAVSRFVPGLRLPTYFAAGLLRTRFVEFSLYFFLAVGVWTPLLVAFAMLLGDRAVAAFEAFERHALPALLLAAGLLVVLVRIVVPLFSFRGRRRLAGRWLRIVRWEFWPPWVFYPPVVAWILLLGLRHRSPFLFTAANPGIEAGGVIAESKSEILLGLGAANERVARWCALPFGRRSPDERRAVVFDFMRRHGLDYPVVLKPDAGQRGSGVRIVRDAGELEAYLQRSRIDLVVQEYVPGAEFGLFYCRRPSEEHGRIISITEKRLPEIVGDGVSTVEELVLRDRRAVALADRYLAAQSGRLDEVLGAGQRLRLVELGTHCRGAIFLDGEWLRSEALERAVDELSRGYDGFHFGRYDVRCEDVEQLRRGRGFRVLELNGVTSEATHIYDPKIGLLRAYGVLFRQWSLAFEIGRENVLRGAAPTGLLRLLGLLRAYHATSRLHT